LCFFSAPPAVKPRREDASIVEHNQIVGPQEIGKFVEAAVYQISRFPIQMQEP
jgi:hypothetical protein